MASTRSTGLEPRGPESPGRDHAPIAREPLSLEAFLALPERVTPFEVVDGQPVVSPSPYGPHQRVVFSLARTLDDACPPGFEALPSPADWVLRERPLLVRQPDIVVATHEQALRVPLTAPPLLTVEVLSGGSFERDVVTKRRQYAAFGCRHYWVVDPADGDPAAVTVVVYRADEGGRSVEVARAVGAAPLAVDDPFPVRLTPADLVRARR